MEMAIESFENWMDSINIDLYSQSNNTKMNKWTLRCVEYPKKEQPQQQQVQ